MNAMVGGGSNTNNPYHRQFFRASQSHSPSRIFVFIEKHPDSIADAYFLNKPNRLEWLDLPASYQTGGANLSFCRRLRRDAPLVLLRHQAAAPMPLTIQEAEREDFDWLMARTSNKNYR